MKLNNPSDSNIKYFLLLFNTCSVAALGLGQDEASILFKFGTSFYEYIPTKMAYFYLKDTFLKMYTIHS